MLVVVEHLEDGVSRWLMAEYKEVIRVCRKHNVSIIFTNVKDPMLLSTLKRLGAEVFLEEGWRLFNRSNAIVLDPEAGQILKPWEAKEACCIVVGGIMGDHPPQGRTRIISAFYTNAIKRSLGSYQFSIDGAIKVALEIYRGKNINELRLAGPPVRFSFEGLLGDTVEIELPYIYPTREDGSPDIPEEVKKLLIKGIMWDEVY